MDFCAVELPILVGTRDGFRDFTATLVVKKTLALMISTVVLIMAMEMKSLMIITVKAELPP